LLTRQQEKLPGCANDKCECDEHGERRKDEKGKKSLATYINDVPSWNQSN